MVGFVSTVSNCYNTGEVTGYGNWTGGVMGYVDSSAATVSVSNCYNSGSVKGLAHTGGVVGFFKGASGQGSVIKCYSKGQVTGTRNVGAVIGYQYSTTGLNILNHLYYLNTVGIGAISGEDNESNNIMSTTENITSYKQFLQWIQGKSQI